MANYLIVVPRGNTELLELMSVAFRGHTSFNVVIDRRGSASDQVVSPSNVEAERRAGRLPLGPDEIVVAERAERADRPVSGDQSSRAFQTIPVRRRRARRPLPGTGGSPQRADGAATAC
jgi:hypothetical protein